MFHAPTMARRMLAAKEYFTARLSYFIYANQKGSSSGIMLVGSSTKTELKP